MAVSDDTSLWLAVGMLLVAASAGAVMVWRLLMGTLNYPSKLLLPPPLPPGPKGLPVIGILHKLAGAHGGRGPHRVLAELAGTYGDIMYVQLGSFPAVVASSIEAARLFLKTHDAAFASRPPNAMTEYVFYGGRDATFSPYGDHWRQARKLCVVHLFTTDKIASFRHVREEESRAMAVELWRRSCRGAMAVDLSAAFRAVPFNIMWRTLAGDTFPELLEHLMKIVSHISEFASLPLVGDYVPWLRWFDLPTIWRMKKDMFTGGTETTVATLEWSTTLLLKHLSCAQKLQQEIDHVVGRDRQVQESDISHMKYLHCVVKESMRLCTVSPLGLPHFSTKEVTVQGFTLPKGTVLMVNYWAMNRDPAMWKSPEEFRPERFMHEDVVDLSGLSDSKSLPFGAGRRVCPGIPMALPTILLVLARLFHTFELVPHGEIDMEVGPGTVMSRKNPLVAIPNLRLNLEVL